MHAWRLTALGNEDSILKEVACKAGVAGTELLALKEDPGDIEETLG